PFKTLRSDRKTPAGICNHTMNSGGDLRLKVRLKPRQETMLRADPVRGVAGGRAVPLNGAYMKWIADDIFGCILQRNLRQVFRIAREQWSKRGKRSNPIRAQKRHRRDALLQSGAVRLIKPADLFAIRCERKA